MKLNLSFNYTNPLTTLRAWGAKLNAAGIVGEKDFQVQDAGLPVVWYYAPGTLTYTRATTGASAIRAQVNKYLRIGNLCWWWFYDEPSCPVLAPEVGFFQVQAPFQASVDVPLQTFPASYVTDSTRTPNNAGYLEMFPGANAVQVYQRQQASFLGGVNQIGFSICFICREDS